MEQNYFVDTPWTWKERLKFKLFPSKLCELPKAPALFEDCLFVNTIVYLSFMDRLRVLITGKLKIEHKVVTEFTIGDSVAASVCYPIISEKG